MPHSVYHRLGGKVFGGVYNVSLRQSAGGDRNVGTHIVCSVTRWPQLKALRRATPAASQYTTRLSEASSSLYFHEICGHRTTGPTAPALQA